LHRVVRLTVPSLCSCMQPPPAALFAQHYNSRPIGHHMNSLVLRSTAKLNTPSVANRILHLGPRNIQPECDVVSAAVQDTELTVKSTQSNNVPSCVSLAHRYMVADYQRYFNLPVAIMRPTLISSCARDPYPGEQRMCLAPFSSFLLAYYVCFNIQFLAQATN
jgi:hypothetical protein